MWVYAIKSLGSYHDDVAQIAVLDPVASSRTSVTRCLLILLAAFVSKGEACHRQRAPVACSHSALGQYIRAASTRRQPRPPPRILRRYLRLRLPKSGQHLCDVTHLCIGHALSRSPGQPHATPGDTAGGQALL